MSKKPKRIKKWDDEGWLICIDKDINVIALQDVTREDGEWWVRFVQNKEQPSDLIYNPAIEHACDEFYGLNVNDLFAVEWVKYGKEHKSVLAYFEDDE